jgi:hypothetical protein
MTRVWTDKEGFSRIFRGIFYFFNPSSSKKIRVISVPPLQASPAQGRSRPDETADTAQYA